MKTKSGRQVRTRRDGTVEIRVERDGKRARWKRCGGIVRPFESSIWVGHGPDGLVRKGPLFRGVAIQLAEAYERDVLDKSSEERVGTYRADMAATRAAANLSPTTPEAQDDEADAEAYADGWYGDYQRHLDLWKARYEGFREGRRTAR